MCVFVRVRMFNMRIYNKGLLEQHLCFSVSSRRPPVTPAPGKYRFRNDDTSTVVTFIVRCEVGQC